MNLIPDKLLPGLNQAERDTFRARMRVPVFSFLALLALLAAIVLIGALIPSGTASYVEAGLTVCMIATVLLFSMEVKDEAPLTRFFALLGFAWVLILLGMTTLDYVSR